MCYPIIKATRAVNTKHGYILNRETSHQEDAITAYQNIPFIYQT